MRLLGVVLLLFASVAQAKIVVLPAEEVVAIQGIPSQMPKDFLFVRHDKIILSDLNSIQGQ